MTLENWDEIRTAYQVARVGTVSGAAEALGVHHATVIRHIDALETRLGAKLFQRHARGYTPTDAGRELLAVAQAADDRFSQMAARIGGARDEVAGELIVTSLPNITGLIEGAILRLMEAHPALTVRYLTDARLFRLEYGEAHVAVRAGTRPQDPDNVVQPLMVQSYGLYGTQAYIDRHGRPAGEGDLPGHRFVGPDDPQTRAPFWRWLLARVPASALAFRSNDVAAIGAAIRAGVGLGFLPVAEAAAEPALVGILPARDDWAVHYWLVTHVDLHRTAKVQGLVAALKGACREGGSDG